MITSMKKIGLLFGTFALVALYSCSSDEVISQKDEAAIQTTQSIAFNPGVSKVTRSTVYTPSSMFTSFKVAGYWNAVAPATYYVKGETLNPDPAPAAGAVYGAFTPGGLEIVSNNGAWDYKTQSEIQYWPFSATKSGDEITGYNCLALDFRAFAPATSAPDYLNADFAYTTPDAASDMVDICYAYADNKTNANSPIKMEFKHLFSQIIFKAKKASNYVVDIKDIKIGGVGNNGTYAQSTLQGLTDAGILLTIDHTTTKSYAGFTSASAISVPDQDASASPYQITPANQALLLLPQTIEKWAHNGTSATESKQGYIAITYRAKKAGDDQWTTFVDATNTPDGYKTVYYPLAAKWYSGKKYIYTLLFGGATDPDDTSSDPDNPDPGSDPGDNPGGYDDSGTPEPPSVPITFTASVLDWTEQIIDVSF